MRLVFWVSLTLIVYTYIGYPLLIAALARLYLRPHRRAAFEAGAVRPFSIVIAVHNGQGLISDTINHVLHLDQELVEEIIVVSDGSTDRTNQILEQAIFPRLRTVILPVRQGKSAAVNAGVALARSEFLLFLDLRPRVEPGALASMLASFADPSVGCVAGELLLRTEFHDAGAAAVSGLYWKYEQWIRNCEAAFHSPVGVYGGFYAARRAVVRPLPAGTILDDMFQPLSIIRQGYRSVIDRSAHVVDVWPTKLSGEFSRKVRTLLGNFQLIALAPWVLTPENPLVFQLISHKLLRLVVPYLLLAVLASSLILGLTIPAFAVFTFIQLAFWSMAALAIQWRLPIVHKISSPASALLVLNAAAVVALYRFVFTRGPLWKTWAPTSTTHIETSL